MPPLSTRSEPTSQQDFDSAAYMCAFILRHSRVWRRSALPKSIQLAVPAPEQILTTDDNLRATFENYLNAFFVSSPAERERLMRANVAADVAFSNPSAAGHGLDTLLGHIDRFEQRFQGGRFQINWFRKQHGQVLAEWTQFNKDGSEFITGTSYARVGDDGRITHFAGFWDS